MHTYSERLQRHLHDPAPLGRDEALLVQLVLLRPPCVHA